MQEVERKIEEFKLENYQSENGLFPAAINSKHQVMNENFWLRDNYYIYLAVGNETREKMLGGFREIFDTHKTKKIMINTKVKPTEDYMYIHPVYGKSLREITNEKFGWPCVQHDCVGNLLEIFSQTKNPDDKERAEVLIDYLHNIEVWKNPDYGHWERWPKEVRASSISAVLRGAEEFRRNHSENTNPFTQNKIEEIISLGYDTLDSVRYDGETPSRGADLALLSLIWPGKLNEKIINRDVKKNIIQRVKILTGEYGVKRYVGDNWDGLIDKTKEKGFVARRDEMEWTMGLPWLYLATKNEKYLNQIRGIKKEFGTIPEGFIDEIPNCTPCLLWAEAMYIIAERESEKIESKIKPIITYQVVDKN